MKFTRPDENGSAYVYLGSGSKVAKTVSREVLFDLNSEGELLGIEILGCPPIAETWGSRLSRMSIEAHMEQNKREGEDK